MKNIYCISICIVLHSETDRFGLRNGPFCDAKRPVLQRQTIGFAKRLKFNELQTRLYDKSIPNYFYNSFSRFGRTKSTIAGINQPWRTAHRLTERYHVQSAAWRVVIHDGWESRVLTISEILHPSHCMACGYPQLKFRK